MKRQRILIGTLALVLLLALTPWITVPASAVFLASGQAEKNDSSREQGPVPSIAKGSTTSEPSLPSDVPADWWGTVQADIRQSEYHVTWQDQTYLRDLPAPSAGLTTGAYQAPNRAHNLRTYFTPLGIRVIPRVTANSGQRSADSVQGNAEGLTTNYSALPTIPWEWGLTLIGYGYAEDNRPVSDAKMAVSANRVEYHRGTLTEWYVNDERGLEQGFTLAAPPQSTIQNPNSKIVLDLALTGDLNPNLTDDALPNSGQNGQAIEFTTSPSTSSGRDGGVRVLRYSDLYATDATGRHLPAHLSLIERSDATRNTRHATRNTHPTPLRVGDWRYAIRITVDTAHATYPITVDPLATSPNWTAESNQAHAQFGYSVGTAGDVNGDGYADVIIGAPQYDNGQTDEGQAYVYHGSAMGLSTTPAWIAEGDQANARFGGSVGTAGDVNGDGYADVIVGALLYDNGETDEGRAFVYHGSAAGLSTTADWTAESDQVGAFFGTSPGTAGDVNGDGYADVIIGANHYDNGQANEGRAFVYYGSAAGLSATPDWTAESDQAGALFGTRVDTAGDVNGDGYADVVVGAIWYSNGESWEGKAYVFHGSAAGLSATPDWAIESNQAHAHFGYSVGTAGDVNGDGYSDVIVGAPSYHDWYDGRVFVYFGSATGLSTTADWTADDDQADTEFGFWSGTAGDVNGDGYADVIVGAKWYDNGQTNEGRAYVYHGSATGLSTSPDWTVESDQDGAEFGWPVGTAGDVNGDGYADVIVGARLYDNGQTDEGRAFVYHGSAAGLRATPDWTAESDQAGAVFGNSVGTAGDVNGDGYADVIIGAYRYDNGQANEGRAFVYYGSAAGLSTTADWTAEINQDEALFGWSVGTAGDANGDGYADVIIGAQWYSMGQPGEGAAFVYYGSATGLSATVSWTAESNQHAAYFGFSVSTAGDVNADGFADVIIGAYLYNGHQENTGGAFVYHGSETGLDANGTRPSGTPANADWAVESDQVDAQFGVSVGTAGDVNGDGFADVIVGACYYDGGQRNEGRAYVYHGSASGPSATANWMAESDQDGAELGEVGTAGDVNGDGYADVIVGAPRYSNGQTEEGEVFAYYGSVTGLDANGTRPSGTPANADWIAESDQARALFGFSVGTAGDINGDGYADVIASTPWYDNGETNEGGGFVYHGSATGLSTTADWTAESNQARAFFGYSVGTAGDVNGDGYADVIVGAAYYDSGQTDEGATFVYYGNGGAGLSLTPRQMRTDGSAPIAPLGNSDSATAVQLRLTGRSPLGREKVKLQWQVAPLGTPFTDPGTINGTSSSWIDTGTGGVEIIENVTGLTPGTPYHWRARLLYRPGNRLGQRASRWIHIPWNGWTETDFRTPIEPPLPAEWSDICAPHRVEITGIGMGDRHHSINPQTLSLADPDDVNWLLAQVAGRGVPVPDSVTLTTDAPQSLTLVAPTTSSPHGYTFEADLQPTAQITASVSDAGNSYKTPRGLVLYSKRAMEGKWTSVGKTTNEYVWAGSGDYAHTEVLTFPPLEEATDLFITAVVIDNDDDLRPMVLEATAGGVTESVTELGPTDGDGLNVVNLTLQQVPTDTNQVSVTLRSPSENGDSLVLVGLNVSYPCPGAILHVVPSPATIPLGVTDVLTITVTPGPAEVNGVQVHGRLDPTYLHLVDVRPTEVLPVELDPVAFDPATGEFRYGAGLLSGVLTEPFPVLVLEVQAVMTTTGTLIEFLDEFPPTDISGPDGSVMSQAQDGLVIVTPAPTLQGAVDMQGRPAKPAPPWAIPLTVWLTPVGSTLPYTYTTTTDQYGQFGLYLDGITPGSYDVRVKGNHTLRNLAPNVSLVSGDNPYFFHTLLEGDAETVATFNQVLQADANVLIGSFNQCQGDPDFVPNADLDESNCVLLPDFGLLSGNFGQEGDMVITPTTSLASGRLQTSSSGALMAFRAEKMTVAVDEVVTLTLDIDPRGELVNGGMVHLNFDPTLVEVVEVALTDHLPLVLAEPLVDNQQGVVRFGAGVLGRTLGEKFSLATLSLKVKQATPGTTITLADVFPATDISGPEGSVLAKARGATLTTEGPVEKTFLPIIMKE